MQAKRLDATRTQQRDAAAELFSKAKIAQVEASETADTADNKLQPLRERLSEFRQRLVIKEPQLRWWQPNDR